jgi:hypothetical protein
MASEIKLTMEAIRVNGAKLAAMAGPNHGGATAVPGACEAMTSLKLDMIAYHHQHFGP